jgi:hypothetical protein
VNIIYRVPFKVKYRYCYGRAEKRHANNLGTFDMWINIPKQELSSTKQACYTLAQNVEESVSNYGHLWLNAVRQNR